MEKYALAAGLPRRVPGEEAPASTDSELAERLALLSPLRKVLKRSSDNRRMVSA
ncbi:hypothetical protein LEMLEM_LOCUS19826 [Lemmus lemmus]